MIELTWLEVGFSLLPLILAGWLYGRAVDDWRSVAWATLRMVVQLVTIGYALAVIFNVQHPLWVLLAVLVMSTGAGWIAVRPIRALDKPYWPVMMAVALAGALHLAWILLFVIKPDPWFAPMVVIPLAGMVMANTMNSVSLCAERFWSDMASGKAIAESQKTAMTAAMIPQINSLMAVGLVSLPGMMTGQILSGVSPLIAVRYQIVIMAMILATAALGSFLFLTWSKASAATTTR